MSHMTPLQTSLTAKMAPPELKFPAPPPQPAPAFPLPPPPLPLPLPQSAYKAPPTLNPLPTQSAYYNPLQSYTYYNPPPLNIPQIPYYNPPPLNIPQMIPYYNPPPLNIPQSAFHTPPPVNLKIRPLLPVPVLPRPAPAYPFSRPPMGFTENSSATCLDFFFHVVPDSPAHYISEQLPKAWAHDALTTLKLICNLRDVRGTGKSDKEGFYTAALWLHQHHPKTLACNLASFAELGYFKDLPEILYRILGKNQKTEWLSVGRLRRRSAIRRGRTLKLGLKVGMGQKHARTVNRREPKEIRIINRNKAKLGLSSGDPDYQFLHERVSDIFAECFKSDMESLCSNEQHKKISLAAKCCPSLDSSFDRATLLCESIARKVFPRESYPEYEGVEEAHYAYRVRDRLRKEVLLPLRKALELPEVYMGAQHWGLIPYNRVASVTMKLYKDKFLKAGKSTIAAGALLPHEIIASLDNWDGSDVAELQWKRMVDDLLKEGKMNNCLAVCDVSGSMDGTPMDVCVALGLLVSELSDEPWKGKVITFSQNPQLHLIQGDSLWSKCSFVRTMQWGMKTNFQKVFDLILKVAVNGQLKPENMIKRVFVFSDMEFDQASVNSWETDYEAIQRKFREMGYENAVPQIVFWNLRHSRSAPVPQTQPGVALLTGFSKNLLNLFLDNGGEIRPDLTMEAAISGPEYQKLLVLD